MSAVYAVSALLVYVQLQLNVVGGIMFKDLDRKVGNKVALPARLQNHRDNLQLRSHGFNVVTQESVVITLSAEQQSQYLQRAQDHLISQGV